MPQGIGNVSEVDAPVDDCSTRALYEVPIGYTSCFAARSVGCSLVFALLSLRTAVRTGFCALFTTVGIVYTPPSNTYIRAYIDRSGTARVVHRVGIGESRVAGPTYEDAFSTAAGRKSHFRRDPRIWILFPRHLTAGHTPRGHPLTPTFFSPTGTSFDLIPTVRGESKPGARLDGLIDRIDTYRSRWRDETEIFVPSSTSSVPD